MRVCTLTHTFSLFFFALTQKAAAEKPFTLTLFGTFKGRMRKKEWGESVNKKLRKIVEESDWKQIKTQAKETQITSFVRRVASHEITCALGRVCFWKGACAPRQLYHMSVLSSFVSFSSILGNISGNTTLREPSTLKRARKQSRWREQERLREQGENTS